MTKSTLEADPRKVVWRSFAPGNWQDRVDVRDFIERNYTPS